MKKDFNSRVWAALKKIPRGKVITYKDIARLAGSPLAYRAAGNALNKNPHPITVPCHRVVGSSGALVGYAHGLAKKKTLLLQEGVLFKNGKIDLRVCRAKIK